jgi:hypothetical protein
VRKLNDKIKTQERKKMEVSVVDDMIHGEGFTKEENCDKSKKYACIK